MRKSWAVVVPSNRPDRLIDFLNDWEHYLADRAKLYIVVDAPGVQGEILEEIDDHRIDAEVHSWSTVRAKKAVPFQTDMIRSWGIYRAWVGKHRYTLSLDDDVRWNGRDILAAYEDEFVWGRPCSRYLSVGAMTTSDVEMRGFPIADRKPAKVMVQYGGWSGILDYDATTQIDMIRIPDEEFRPYVMPVPQGAPVTCCAMNMAWLTEWAPIMWQLPLHNGKFNRWGDIWSGLLQKLVVDYMGGVMVVNGLASVRHDRASDPHANQLKEAHGIDIHNTLWDTLVSYFHPPSQGTMMEVYWAASSALAEAVRPYDDDWAEHFLEARAEWLGLFDPLR